MVLKDQENFFETFTANMKSTMFRKGSDYSNTDRLSNFKYAGSICGLTAEQNCLSLIATKVARLGVLLDPTAKAPNNESINDSVLDLANYAVLLRMIIEERYPEEIANKPDEPEDLPF